ncbi:MAG TPA: DNA repair protein RecN [Ignavibacteriaceae bacterium]|nr:DNA repair protein RecN [Ignavibacteriaceae bacterium]
MLKYFQVKDYALIEFIEVNFETGLNIITGETGAGKSILVDAMSLLLGERASTEVIRKNSSKAIVEGIFEVENNKKVKSFLERNELDVSPELIMRREISLKGTNRAFLNDTPVSLNLFKEAGNLLVDLHGQHEHQSLLRTETHIDYLDQFADNEEYLEAYKKEYQKLQQLINDLNNLIEKENSIREKKDFYSFQIKEIDAVNPIEGEEESISDELNKLENAEKIIELSEEVYQNLYDAEVSAYDLLVKVKNDLNELNKIDKELSNVTNEGASVLAIIKDIADFIRNYKNNIELEPEHLEDLRSRLGTIILLKKKYGGSIKSILDYRQKIGESVDLAENFSNRIDELKKQIKLQKEAAGKAAEVLTSRRKKAAAKAEKDIQSFLADLGIEKSIFKIKIEETENTSSKDLSVISDGKEIKANNKGKDIIEFFISTNLGEDPKPLVKVASGGEVSRIMLSLKSVLAKNDKLPLLIFDEIDTGVSGRIAQKIGRALSILSSSHQIIAITHLPQIAACSNVHFAVEKNTLQNRVVSSIRKLILEEKIQEVAKLLSGENITDSSLKSAKELIESSSTPINKKK